MLFFHARVCKKTYYWRGDYFINVEPTDEPNNFEIVFIWDPQ